MLRIALLTAALGTMLVTETVADDDDSVSNVDILATLEEISEQSDAEQRYEEAITDGEIRDTATANRKGTQLGPSHLHGGRSAAPSPNRSSMPWPRRPAAPVS